MIGKKSSRQAYASLPPCQLSGSGEKPPNDLVGSIWPFKKAHQVCFDLSPSPKPTFRFREEFRTLEAYESPRGTNPRGASAGLWGF